MESDTNLGAVAQNHQSSDDEDQHKLEDEQTESIKLQFPVNYIEHHFLWITENRKSIDIEVILTVQIVHIWVSL